VLLHPAVLALLVTSVVVCVLAAAAAAAGIASVAGWDPEDGGERQLARERRMLLVEATVTVVCVTQLIALVAFVATVDRLHPLFSGAMCAVGTLNAEPHGVPSLLVKIATVGLCGLWLVVQRATVAAPATGVVRVKHLAVPVLAGLLVTDAVLQWRFFTGLEPDVITSCCARVFGGEAPGIGANLAAVPPSVAEAAYFGMLLATLALGVAVVRGLPLSGVFAAAALALGAVAGLGVVTWVAPSWYELPTHHCPLCVLAPEMHLVGYPLYGALAVAVLGGVGSGVVRGLRRLDAEAWIAPAQERRLCVASMVGFAAFTALAVWPLLTSDFRLGGY
jgi:hypothetical protein